MPSTSSSSFGGVKKKRSAHLLGKADVSAVRAPRLERAAARPVRDDGGIAKDRGDAGRRREETSDERKRPETVRCDAERKRGRDDGELFLASARPSAERTIQKRRIETRSGV